MSKSNLKKSFSLNIENLKFSDSHKAVFQLVNKFFWKTKIGSLSFFVFPLSFMLIYFFIGMDSTSSNIFSSGLPAFFSFGILPITLVVLPQMLVEIKSSILLRKIAVSNLSKTWYILIVLSTYFLIVILEALYVLIMYFIFLNNDLPKAIENVNWGYLVFGLLSLFMVAVTFGVMLGVIFNTSMSVQLVGFAIVMATLLFSGQFIPIQVIGDVAAIKYIALFSPLSYSLGIINNVLIPYSGDPTNMDAINAFNQGANIFDFSNTFFIYSFGEKVGEDGKPIYEAISIYQGWQKALNIFMPFALFIGVNILSLKRFKWSNR
ncbi:MAG: ABC transporter permease [Metamycoplasmataceae bacterium]